MTFLATAIYVKAIGIAVIGLAVAVLMLSLARGKRFTAYAELMRVKRIYLQDRREYLAELVKQGRSRSKVEK